MTREKVIEVLVEAAQDAIEKPSIPVEEVEVLGQVIGLVALGEIEVVELR